MTDNEQIEIVAKELGWRWDDLTVTSPSEASNARFSYGRDQLYELLPDCLNDLNVCAGFEAKFNSEYQGYLSSPQFKTSYPLILECVVARKNLWDNGTFIGNKQDIRNAQQATARQRTKALLIWIEAIPHDDL